MKRPFILVFVFVFTCIAYSHAQNEATARQTPAIEILKQREGEVVDFQKLLRRYETAIKENDVSSVIDLRADVVAFMQKRVDTMTAEKALGTEQTATLKEQKTILKGAKGFVYSGNREDYNKAVEHVRQLQKFATLMQSNFETK